MVTGTWKFFHFSNEFDHSIKDEQMRAYHSYFKKNYLQHMPAPTVPT